MEIIDDVILLHNTHDRESLELMLKHAENQKKLLESKQENETDNP